MTGHRRVVDNGHCYVAVTASRKCQCGDVVIVRIKSIMDEPVWPECPRCKKEQSEWVHSDRSL
jgi:hypothetical protein